ncbi:MAG: radical SAM family heme chaperone HemW [Acidobacteriia bacterium]|nr:radical SAM family heme chaperone HemW [Terriglobia bacterium]
MDTLGIYIQIPYCASKCSFCNFSSRVERPSIFDTYLAALLREMAELPRFYEAQGISRDVLELAVDTVYFGGGTPTLLGAERLGQLVRSLRRYFRIESQIEFTVECTPGSADGALLEDLRQAGVNRLSIGAQTFDDRELRAVGRLHSTSGTEEMVREARAAGFENISLDLIAGLPYQSEESWRRSLREAARLRPEHVSLYIFEIDEKSRLGHEVLTEGARYHAAVVPDEAFMADAYETGREFLAAEGYAQYEISNFALPGYESRHNQKYWRLAPYVGLGAGAHSFDGVHRWANVTEVERYLQSLAAGHSPISEFQTLSAQQHLEEYFFLGLRQCEGVDLDKARELGCRELPSHWQESIAAFSRQGLMERSGARVRLTERAYLVSNEIFQEFVNA